MNLIRRAPAYPKDRDLARVVQAAAARLAAKVGSLDPHSFSLSPGACSLLCQHLERVIEEIGRCAQVFAWALPQDDKPFSDLSLVAFADRLGLFALLARECNIGTVVCHNAEGADVDDARIVAKALGSPADHYVFGDLEDLEFVLKNRGLSCDVFVSRGALDVMENLHAFFDTACRPSNGLVSFGLGYGKQGPFGVAGPDARGLDESRALHCRAGLIAAGYRTDVIRSRRVSILKGSGASTFLAAKAPDLRSAQPIPGFEDAAPRT